MIDMKINFKEFPLYDSVKRDKKVAADVSLSLADIIYKAMPGVAAHSLALRIYEADGMMDITDDDVHIIQSAYPVLAGSFQDSFEDFIKNKSNEKDLL